MALALHDMPRSSEHSDAGFFQHLTAMLSSALDYLKARLELAGIEGKDAGVRIAIILALAILALVGIIFGYFFACFGVIFLIAWAIGGAHAWIWVTLGMALTHLGGAVACLVIAKSKFSQPMFPATMQEFKKDHEWLNSKTAKTR